MEAKLKKQLHGADLPTLSQFKAQAVADLKNKPEDADLKELVGFITELINAKANVAEEKVRVKAKNFVTVDGVPFQKDQEGVITGTQFRALSRHFTKLAAVALLALLGLVCGAKAQGYKATPLMCTNGSVPLDGVNGSACIASGGTSNLFITVPAVAKNGEVGIQMSFKLAGSGTSATTAVFDASGDGVNWLTGYASLAVTAANTSQVTGFTNITMNSLGYLRLSYITNASSAILTNLSVKAIYKPQRYGGY